MLYFWGGLFLFFVGLEGIKRCLRYTGEGKVKQILKSFRESLLGAVIFGVFVTVILQSSSAVSIILISLLEADVIDFKPAAAIMLGSNLGTTFTLQLFSVPVLVSGIENCFFLVGLMFVIYEFIRGKKNFYKGSVFLAFGIVFKGLKLMTYYFKQPENQELIQEILAGLNENMFLILLAGTVITMLVQSSSTVTGILVSMVYGGLLSFPVAVFFVLGSNIGTCITAFLAGVSYGIKGRFLAVIHTFYNLCGVICLLPFYKQFISFVSLTADSPARRLANAHSLFNLFIVLFVVLLYYITPKVINILY
ncbi:MAG: Na/Pi cotransporter family protein [Bacillota bacterium]